MNGKFAQLTLTDEVRAAQTETFGQAQSRPRELADEDLGPAERAFLAERDSFYMATVNSDGWPYVQHKGGEKGFLKVLPDGRLAFADLAGNRQLLSVGNLKGDARVALFFMDYARRRRLKVLGRARMLSADDAELRSVFAGVSPSRVERFVIIEIVAYDWNCPQYITPRFSEAEVEAREAGLRARIADLENELEALGASPETDENRKEEE